MTLICYHCPVLQQLMHDGVGMEERLALTEVIYDELIHAILTMVDRLDLTATKAAADDMVCVHYLSYMFLFLFTFSCFCKVHFSGWIRILFILYIFVLFLHFLIFKLHDHCVVYILSDCNIIEVCLHAHQITCRRSMFI